MTARLQAAIDSLLGPGHQTVEILGERKLVFMAPLLAQLTEAVSTGTKSGGGTSGKPGSRPPLNLTALSLRQEIRDTVTEGLEEYQSQPSSSLYRDLEKLSDRLTSVVDADTVDVWTEIIESWCYRIETDVLGKARQTRPLHGLACPNCQATRREDMVHDGVPYYVAAVSARILDGDVIGLSCSVCGYSLDRDQLAALALDVLAG